MEIEDEDKRVYTCPANNSHKITNIDNFQKHIMRCKDVKGKKFWQCKFNWTHMFRYQEERDFHESKCPEKKEGVPRYKDFLCIAPDPDSFVKGEEKRWNKLESEQYYHKNREKLEYEKEMKRRIRQKNEQQEAQKQEEIKRQKIEEKELNNFYAPDFVLEHSFYLRASFASFFMIQVKNGERKFEKKNLEIKTPIDIGGKLKNISELEYSKILGGEFIAHYEHKQFFTKLLKKLETEGPVSCLDYSEINDELIILTSSKHVPYLVESRVALLVVKNSRFMENLRPFDIPLNNVSHVFVNNYNQYLQQNLVGETEKAYEERNAENDMAIASYEYKDQIKKKLKGIVELLKESAWELETEENKKKEEAHLQTLVAEKEKLKAHEAELIKKEAKLKTSLIDYKRHLTQELVEEVKKKQDTLNMQINDYLQKKVQELDNLEQAMTKKEEEESDLKRVYQTIHADIDARLKRRRKEENRAHYYEQLISEKKRTIYLSKSLALTKVLDSLCHVCQHNRINILYYPCLHFYVCEDCQKKASEAGRHECLYCLKSVERVLRVLV